MAWREDLAAIITTVHTECLRKKVLEIIRKRLIFARSVKDNKGTQDFMAQNEKMAAASHEALVAYWVSQAASIKAASPANFEKHKAQWQTQAKDCAINVHTPT